ncbi:MAG: proton-conducting transporter membrane subunit [Pseudomonadota bacterium]
METIILFAPLAGALMAGLTWRVISDAGAQWAATGFAFFAAILSWVVWISFSGDMQQIYVLDWVRSGTLDAALAIRLDAISAEMMVIVTTTSALAHLYAMGFMERDKAFDEGRSFRPRFFAYLSLFTFAMLILVTADNLLQLVLGLQVSGVMAYLLIAFRLHYKNANAAAIKTFVVSGIGHAGMILGTAGLYALTDSVALDDIFAALPDLDRTPLLFGLSGLELSSGLILLGALAISAQVLFHVWLPDAMEAPAPAAALLSAVFVAGGAFIIWRLAPIYAELRAVSNLMLGMGAATALIAGVVASAQTDIKRTMGFVASAQMGMIFAALGLDLGLGLYNIASVQIPLFVVVQAMLVLCVGAITRAFDDNRDMRGFGGLRQKLPTIALTMTLAALVATGFGVAQSSLAVFAPETGNLLFEFAFAAHPVTFWVLTAAAGLGVFAIWRVVFLSFNGPSRAPQDVFNAVERSPTVMVVTLAALSVLMLGSVVWEINTLSALTGLAAPAWISMSPFVATVLGFVLALWFYILQPALPKTLASSMKGLHELLRQGFYVDRVYELALTAPLKRLGGFLSDVGDGRVLDGAVAALSARLAPSYSDIVDRRFGGVLLCGAALVLFGLVAVITWTVLTGGQG